jgi:ligand-binding sensor domain-containing protein/signal transduction histidine kinase
VIGTLLPRSCKRLCAPSAVLFAFSLLLTPRTSALDPGKRLTQYAHRIWGQEEGLFQPTIYSILQTKDGFLWLGTQDSLIRFDGMRFREFDLDGSAVQHSLVRDLAQDREGNLWAALLGAGVARIAPTGIVTRYNAQNGLPSDTTFCVVSDLRDAIWICTDRGLARFERGHFRVFTTADGLPSNGIRSTCEAAGGTRWISGLDFGLAHSKGERFVPYSDPRIAPRDNVTSLLCATDGSLWAGKESGLVQVRTSGSRSFTVRDGLPDDNVSALAQASDGGIWIGTNDGVSRYREGEFSVYRTRDGLSHSLVLSLYVDAEGSLWAGTKDGLDQFSDAKVTPFNTDDGMASNETGPVLEDAAGHLWIGTLDRGLNVFDGRAFSRLTTRDGLASDTVLSLASDPSGGMWVGTAAGLNLLRHGTVVNTYTQQDGLPSSEIRAIFIDSQATLWAGTSAGLARLAGSHFVRAHLTDATNNASIVALAGGRTVRLFVSTSPPALFSIANQSTANYPLDILHPIDCYYLDHVRHAAWMGTLGSGLLRWENQKLTHVRVKDGLYDNRIYSLLRDDHANLWMASSKGIFRVGQRELEDFADGKTRSITSLPFSTGQLRFECRSGVQPAACRTRDGRLWFSTTNGLVVVDPDHLVTNPVPPPVQVTAVVVNGRRSALDRSLSFKPFENNVEIRYAGLSFVSPEKVSFRYLLEGYEKSWTDAGARREAFFTNLPPGDFRFKVMARNADGIWSRQAATVGFRIQPRLYQHAWFFPMLAAALALAGVGAYRMRIRQLNQRFHLLLSERTRIARELHDTLLQGLSGVTMQLQALWTRLPASKEKQLLGEIIKDAGRCSAEARHSLWGLRTGGTPALHFHDKLAELARQAVAAHPISLGLRLEPVPLVQMPETEYQLLRIAQEAISNALAHAGAHSLEVVLLIDAGVLRLSIADDGIGFSSAGHPPFGHFGLTGMRERAAEIGAALALDSSPQSGTRVTIELPLSASRAFESNVDPRFEHQINR